MKILTAKEIKRFVLGIVLTDGHIDVAKKRFDMYCKDEAYLRHVYNVLTQISQMKVTLKVKEDKRGYVGWRLWTAGHVYWEKMARYTYDGRKVLTPYAVSRIDARCLAAMWAADGYMEHAKNRNIDKCQNIGWFCLEAFTQPEQQLMVDHLRNEFGINSRIVSVRWGFGTRIKISGMDLQKLCSLLYPEMHESFMYKLVLYYKSRDNADMSLPKAEHFIVLYDGIEDIVRHSLKKETT